MLSFFFLLNQINQKVVEKMNKQFWNQNGSTILTCLGGAGVIATAVVAVKSTPKALELLKEAEVEKGEELTRVEKIKMAGPVYIPSILIGIGTLSCIFGANIMNKRHQAALVSAYTLLDSSFKEYKQKVKNVYGEDGEKTIRAELAKDKLKDVDLDEYEDEYEDEKQLFYDEYSKRYFRATNETVLRAEYELNKLLAEDCYVGLNELYDLLGIDPVDYGEYVGWSSAQMFEMYWSSWINFHHEKVEMEDGMECFIIHFTEPMADFGDY